MKKIFLFLTLTFIIVGCSTVETNNKANPVMQMDLNKTGSESNKI